MGGEPTPHFELQTHPAKADENNTIKILAVVVIVLSEVFVTDAGMC